MAHFRLFLAAELGASGYGISEEARHSQLVAVQRARLRL